MKINDIFNHFIPLSTTFFKFASKNFRQRCYKAILGYKYLKMIEYSVGDGGSPYFSRSIVNLTNCCNACLYTESGKPSRSFWDWSK